MPTDYAVLTDCFVLPSDLARESGPQACSWADFADLMDTVEALCGAWPPARTEPFRPGRIYRL